MKIQLLKIILSFIPVLFLSSCLRPQALIRVDMTCTNAYRILEQNGYSEISLPDDMIFLNGATWWLSRDNTCILINQYQPEPDSSISLITVGESGNGCNSKNHWLNQKLSDVTEYYP